MPNIAQFHPQVVHFVVALLFVGLGFRVASFVLPRPRFAFAGPAATTLLLIGTVASVLAVRSGTDAHGPVERIPGTRDLVIEHEQFGERTRTIFLVVSAIELAALALSRRASTAGYVRWAYVASAVAWAGGCFVLFEAAEHGGELVYSYAGGPGLRTGDPKDVERLLLAGLYNQSQADRKAGRPAEAAALVDAMVTRFPGDTTVRFLHAESLLRDRKDYPAAMAALDSIPVAPNDPRLGARLATLKADAYLALGRPDSARAVLQAAVAASPQNPRLKAKLDSIK
jgi:uncharacterized membrane protein